MASVNHKVFEHHKDADGKIKIKAVIYHRRSRAYVTTRHTVTMRQLNDDYTIKDKKLTAQLIKDEEEIQKRISALGMEAEKMTARELADRVYHFDEGKSGEDNTRINIIDFGREYVKQLKSDGRLSSASTITPVVNNLADFFGTESVDITEITANMLREFERYLKKDRVQVRPKNGGGTVTTRAKGLGNAGIHTTMRDLRGLFNAAKRRYNTEFATVITHYPFDFYKIPKVPRRKKKGEDLTLVDIGRIRDKDCTPGSTAELARDIFMLSFYLCGMNAKDIYDHTGDLVGGRVEYERSKTHSRRNDGAFISIKVPKVARTLVSKYMGVYLRSRYTSYRGFISAVDAGMKLIAVGNKSKGRYAIEGLGLPKLTFYHARHMFATLANTECGYTTEEIARVLNHVDESHKVTSGYIAYDWSLIDRIQSDVLRLLSRKKARQ